MLQSSLAEMTRAQPRLHRQFLYRLNNSILLLLFLCSVQVFSSLLTQEILQSIMASCEFLLYGPSEAFFALHQQAYG